MGIFHLMVWQYLDYLINMKKDEISLKLACQIDTDSYVLYVLNFIILILMCVVLFFHILFSSDKFFSVVFSILLAFLVLYLVFRTIIFLRLMNKKIELENDTLKLTEGITGHLKIKVINLNNLAKINIEQSNYLRDWILLIYFVLDVVFSIPHIYPPNNILCFIYKNDRQETFPIIGFNLEDIHNLLSAIEKKHPGLTKTT